jgi:pilus assembly protein CpaB
MRPKSLALLLLALGCGLVASIGITKVMTKSNGDGEGAGGESVGIFIATADIGQGDLLASNVVKLEQWPKDKVPPGAILRTEDIENRRTRTRLYAGEPILENRLFAKGANQQGATAMIPIGYRVVPVKVDLVSGGSSLILPGDRVDVMIHLVADANRGISETVTRTILQDVKVFAVNDVLDIEKEKDGGKSIAAKTISLLVTPEQAAKVMLAAQMGVVNLVMRSPEDDKKTVDAEARTSQLMGIGTESKREKEDPKDTPSLVKAPVVVASPPAGIEKIRTTWNMKVIKGSAVDEVSFEKDPNPDSASPTGPWKVAAPASGAPIKDDDVKGAAPPVVGEPTTDPAPPAQPPLPPILPPAKPLTPIKGK